MRTIVISAALILVCFIIISFLRWDKAHANVGKGEVEIPVNLEAHKKVVRWEEPWCLIQEDIDNDGSKETILGLTGYKCNLWTTWIGEDLKWLTEMPLSGVVFLRLYKFEKGQYKFVRDIVLEKNADYIPPSKLEIKHFKIGDFNHDGLKEIFFAWDNGMKLEAKIIQIRGNKLRTLYSGPPNREEVELKDIDKDGKCEVLEKGLTWHIATEEEMEKFLKGHLFAIRIHKWNSSKKRWLPWKIVPDRETEKTLTREEVLEGIGAREILKGVPLKRLKELYPRAFK